MTATDHFAGVRSNSTSAIARRSRLRAGFGRRLAVMSQGRTDPGHRGVVPPAACRVVPCGAAGVAGQRASIQMHRATSQSAPRCKLVSRGVAAMRFRQPHPTPSHRALARRLCDRAPGVACGCLPRRAHGLIKQSVLSETDAVPSRPDQAAARGSGCRDGSRTAHRERGVHHPDATDPAACRPGLRPDA